MSWFDIAPGALFITDKEGAILRANQAFKQLTGYMNIEADQPHFSALINLEQTQSNMLAGLSSALGGMLAWDGEIIFDSKNGQMLSVRLQVAPVTSRQGKIPFAIVSIEDLSNQFSNQTCKVTESCWRFVVEECGDGLWDWHLPTGKVYRSPQFKAMLGFAEYEMGDEFNEWEELVFEEDRGQIDQALDSLLNGTEPLYQVIFRMRMKDNTYKWIESRGKIMESDANGKAIRIVGTHRDITEVHNLRSTIAEQEILLAEAAKQASLIEFGSLITHELAEPLTAINNLAELACRRLKDSDLDLESKSALIEPLVLMTEQVREVGTIMTGVRRLLHREPLNLSPVSVNQLCRESQDLITQNMLLNSNNDYDNTPEIEVLALADRSQIMLVIRNLLRNALKATTPPLASTIQLSWQVINATKICIYVENSGPPLSAEIQATLQDPFHRKDRKGFGLAICSSILALHDSQLQYHHDEGLTRFSFLLQRA